MRGKLKESFQTNDLRKIIGMYYLELLKVTRFSVPQIKICVKSLTLQPLP